jgi:PDZ domain/Aspartyl protease
MNKMAKWVKNMMVLACLGGLFSVSTQKTYALPAYDKKTPTPLARFNFHQLYGGVIVIRAAIDNHPDSLNFILDTGSGGISLDSSTAQELKITTEPSGRTIRGIAGVKQVNFAYNHILKLPGLLVDSLDFHINDYEMLSGVYGLKIDGIIGYSFFRRFIVNINFDEDLILVYPKGDFPYPKGGHMLNPAIASLPMQFAEVTDNTTLSARYYIDTGAGLCLLLSNQYVKDSLLFNPGKLFYSTVAEGIGGKKEMSITVVKKFKMGGYSFKNMPTYVFDDEFNVTSYPFLAGLIGNDLLRRFNLVINYGKSEFHLIPNKSFREPFDYAYYGFNMFQDGVEVLIIDVIPGSPAAKAGLKDNDIILSISNKFGGNLQDYKNILQNPGSKVKMVVIRDKTIEEIQLKIGDFRKKIRPNRK